MQLCVGKEFFKKQADSPIDSRRELQLRKTAITFPNKLYTQNGEKIYKSIVTFFQGVVPFKDAYVDAIFNVSECFLYFFKDSISFLVRSRTMIKVVVCVVTFFCGCRTDWGAISAISWLS